MYDLINQHIQVILPFIPQCHVQEYDFLTQNLPQAGTPEYQHRYKHYWRMNMAIRSANYFAAYFQTLQAAQVNLPILGNLAQQLYQIPTHANNRQSLQFSFVTKLLHMINIHAPIYDSSVASFYLFREPKHTQPLQQRIEVLTNFHAFLVREYGRVLQNGLLAQSIQQFRQHFQPQNFTDEKVIDSLIFWYVALLRNGGLMNGQVIYH